MAYVATELRLIVTNFTSNAGGPQIWCLDTTDPVATVDTANYVSDALTRGVRVGDLVMVRVFSSLATKSTITALQWMIVMSVSATGANLSDGTAVAVTNTD